MDSICIAGDKKEPATTITIGATPDKEPTSKPTQPIIKKVKEKKTGISIPTSIHQPGSFPFANRMTFSLSFSLSLYWMLCFRGRADQESE